MSRKQFLKTSTAGINWSMERVAETGNISQDYAIHSHQEVDHVLDANKAMNTHNDGYSKDRSMRRVASIPLALIQYWKQVEGWDAFDPEHGDKLVAKMNDPEWQHLRTAPGRLSFKGGSIR